MTDKETATITMKVDRSFGEEARPVINVKWYGPWPNGYWPDVDTSVVYEAVRMAWWRRASEIAHKHGYSGVFAVGRMDGWLLPYRQEVAGRLQYFGGPDEWPWPGEGVGFPTFPDMHNAEERKVFVTFREEIEALLEHVPHMIRNELDRQQQEANVRKGLADPLAALAATEEGRDY